MHHSSHNHMISYSNVGSYIDYPIIAIVMCKNPSAYEANSASSSIFVLKGTMAPCRKGYASRGLRLLGKSDGISAFKAVPSVCGCPKLTVRLSGTIDIRQLIR